MSRRLLLQGRWLLAALLDGPVEFPLERLGQRLVVIGVDALAIGRKDGIEKAQEQAMAIIEEKNPVFILCHIENPLEIFRSFSDVFAHEVTEINTEDRNSKSFSKKCSGE